MDLEIRPRSDPFAGEATGVRAVDTECGENLVFCHDGCHARSVVCGAKSLSANQVDWKGVIPPCGRAAYRVARTRRLTKSSGALQPSRSASVGSTLSPRKIGLEHVAHTMRTMAPLIITRTRGMLNSRTSRPTQAGGNPDPQGENCHGGEQRFPTHHAHAELDVQPGDAEVCSAVEDSAYTLRESVSGHDSLGTDLRLSALFCMRLILVQSRHGLKSQEKRRSGSPSAALGPLAYGRTKWRQ